jgi:hypothetical protein
VDAGLDQLGVRRHGIAPEQVSDVDLANVVDARVAGSEIGHIGHRLHVDR